MVVPCCRKGSSLIEVLTALLIFSIVLTAAFATFTFQKQSYTTQTRVAEMQQNMRVAVGTLLRDIRMGGYGVDSDISVSASVVGGSGTLVMRGFQGADGGSTAPDGIYILYAYDMDNTVPALQPTLTNSSVTAGDSPVVTVTPGTGTRFSSGDVVLLHDGTRADLYQVASSDNGSVTFGTFNAGNHSGSIYDVGSKVSRARFVRYFIDDTTNPVHPILMVTRLPGSVSQPVADDIEDLQFVYGLASSVDNALVSGSAVDWPTAATNTQRRLIRTINLSIIARTGGYEKGWQGQRPTLANRAAGSVDQYRRRILNNMTVDIRNIRLN